MGIVARQETFARCNFYPKTLCAGSFFLYSYFYYYLYLYVFTFNVTLIIFSVLVTKFIYFLVIDLFLL